MSILNLIARVPLFADLTPFEKKRLAALEHTFIRYAKDEYILREDGRNTAFYIVVQGTVRVTRNELPTKIIALLKSGAIFGEMAYLTGAPRSTNVIANETEVVVMKVNEEILALMSPEVREKIKDKLIELLVKRINQMNDALLRRAKQLPT